MITIEFPLRKITTNVTMDDLKPITITIILIIRRTSSMHFLTTIRIGKTVRKNGLERWEAFHSKADILTKDFQISVCRGIT